MDFRRLKMPPDSFRFGETIENFQNSTKGLKLRRIDLANASVDAVGNGSIRKAKGNSIPKSLAFSATVEVLLELPVFQLKGENGYQEEPSRLGG
jgi:hypothetical protein